MKLYLRHKKNSDVRIELKEGDTLLSAQYLWRKNWILVGR